MRNIILWAVMAYHDKKVRRATILIISLLLWLLQGYFMYSAVLDSGWDFTLCVIGVLISIMILLAIYLFYRVLKRNDDDDDHEDIDHFYLSL